LERHRRDRIFSSGDPHKRARQSAFAAAKFKDRLARQEMDGMSESLGPPKQSIIDNWIVLPPVIIAIALTTRQG
jgi:hypothetical protein